jgi:photosystem II stability/assembly factor-like uncharacterized protein
MSRRLAAGLVVGLALSALSPAPGHAQRIPPPELTITPLHHPFNSFLFGVSFPDPQNGIAVGAYHSIFRTTDGGTTWTRQANPLPTREPSVGSAEDPTGQAYMAVSYVDPQHATAVSNDGGVVTTTDGGASWELRQTPAPNTVNATWPGNIRPTAWSYQGVSFVDRDHGYVVGHDGLILATADGGTTWTYRGDPRYGILRDVKFVDEFHGQTVGRVTGRPDQVRYTTLGTNDGGEMWQPNLAKEQDESVLNMTAVAVTVPMHAIAVGEGGRIFVTFDEGKTWRIRRSGTNETLNDVAFADRRRGVAVGTVNFQGDVRSIVLATNNGGEGWTAFPQPEIGTLTAVSFASPSAAYAVGCVDHTSPCRQAALVKIDFPELDASVEEPQSSGSSRLPLYLLGAAVLVGGAGLLLARRR